MPRLIGINVLDPDIRPALTSTDRESITVAMAETLASLHDIRRPHAGEYYAGADRIEPLSMPFGRWIAEQVWAKVRRCEEKAAALAESDIAWIEGVLEDARDMLAEPFVPSFTMHDYWLPNLLFARSDAGWRVCGVFDFAEAYSGDGEADLARPLSVLLRRDPALDDPRLARVFLWRYIELRPPRPGFAQRLAVYLIDDLLLGWGYLRRLGHLDGSQSFRQFGEPFTSAAARLL
jgi:aminoglycoside phosphotransferase (APT) family kinase protein